MTLKFPQGEPWAKNFSAVSYIDLQNRPAFKMAIHRHHDRWFLYAAQPRFVRFVPAPPNT
jgi:hypothetical protein